MIVIVGDIGWDFIVHLDRVPVHGETSIGAVRYDGPGGGSANTAATIAASGRPVALVAAVGADHLGMSLKSACARFPKLQTEFLTFSGATQWATIMIDADGERTIIVARANAVPEATLASLELVEAAESVWINLDDETLRAKYAESTSARRGLPLAHLADEARAGRMWDFVVGSARDHEVPPIADLRTVGAELCVVTEAEAGGRYWAGGATWSRYETPQPRMTKDSTGAGDAFLAGLLVGLVAGEETEAAIRTAASYGSRAVESVGAWPASG